MTHARKAPHFVFGRVRVCTVRTVRVRMSSPPEAEYCIRQTSTASSTLSIILLVVAHVWQTNCTGQTNSVASELYCPA